MPPTAFPKFCPMFPIACPTDPSEPKKFCTLEAALLDLPELGIAVDLGNLAIFCLLYYYLVDFIMCIVYNYI